MLKNYQLSHTIKTLLKSPDHILADLLESYSGNEVPFYDGVLPPSQAVKFFSPQRSPRWDSLRYRYRNFLTPDISFDPWHYRSQVARFHGMYKYHRLSTRITLYTPKDILILAHLLPDEFYIFPRLHQFRDYWDITPMHHKLLSHSLYEIGYRHNHNAESGGVLPKVPPSPQPKSFSRS